MIALLRRPLSALPRNSSLCPAPSTSAVSKKLMPASSGASTTAAVPAASVRQPKLLHPRPTSDTLRDPSLRDSTAFHYSRVEFQKAPMDNGKRDSAQAPDRRLPAAQNAG